MRKLDVFDYVMYHEIFTGLGISFMSGGMIYLLMGSKDFMTRGIVIMGFCFLILGTWFRIKEERFKEDKHWGILMKNKETKNK